MPDELEYIVDKAIVHCDKGAKPNYFRSTYNTHVKIMGCMAATRVDKLPLVNIPEFGVCAVTGSPCTPAPIEWLDTYKLKVKGQETLLYRCKLPCSVGGIVGFITSGQIPISPEELAAMTDENSEVGPPTEEVVEEEVEEEVEQEVDAEEGGDEGLSWWDGVEMIPFVGGVVGTVRSGSKGDWLGVGLSVASVGLDVAGLFSFGGGNVASAAVKGGKLARVAVKAGRAVNRGKKIIKVLRKVKKARVVIKPGIKALTKAGAKRLAIGLAKKVDDIALKTGKICVFACFPAGTLVDTERGKVPIEQVKIGDRVWAFDEVTGAIDLKEVVQTVERESDHTIEIYTDQETIETTAEHPFYTTHGWKDAADLQAGDSIITKGKQELEITKTEFSYEPKRVYNFEVAGWHTYFVGVLSWIAHNVQKCATELAKEVQRKVLKLSRKLYPNHTKMLDNAVDNGHSLKNLKRGKGRKAAEKNRYESQKDIRKKQGGPKKDHDYDEFPYASTEQGGKGAHVEEVLSTENQAAGRDLGKFYREEGIKHGDEFDIDIID